MIRSTSSVRWRSSIIMTGAAWTTLLVHSATAPAQTRVTGLDVSYYQGSLSQSNWNTIHNTDGRAFTFIRSSRGGTTGHYDPSIAANNTLSRRYDDPYYVVRPRPLVVRPDELRSDPASRSGEKYCIGFLSGNAPWEEGVSSGRMAKFVPREVGM